MRASPGSSGAMTKHMTSAVLNQIRAELNRRKYVANLVRDVEKELNVHSAN